MILLELGVDAQVLCRGDKKVAVYFCGFFINFTSRICLPQEEERSITWRVGK